MRPLLLILFVVFIPFQKAPAMHAVWFQENGLVSAPGRNANAPITIANDVFCPPGESISIPITVTDFNNIGAISLTLHYNPGVLTYISFSNTSGFPGLFANNSSPGTMIIGGFNMNPNGFTIPDGSVLFTLHFNYSYGISGLIWYDDGTSCEYSGPSPDFQPLNDVPTSTYYINGSVMPTPHPLSGTIIYRNANGPGIPMQNIDVSLKDSTGSILAAATTNSSGHYGINPVPPGVTQLEVSSPIPWGGVNATDALAIKKKAVGMPVSFWFPENFIDNIADLDTNAMINATDALLVGLRAVQLITDFDAGDWAFFAEGTNFINTSANSAMVSYSGQQQLSIEALCYGDVNGSYNPNAVKSFKPLSSSDIIYTNPGETLMLPVKINSHSAISAASIFLKYDKDIINVLGLESDIPGLHHKISDGTISLVWYYTEPHIPASDKNLFSLIVESTGDISSYAPLFYLSSETEFADANCRQLKDVDVTMPMINIRHSINFRSDEVLPAIRCYPNPFTNVANIEYMLPERANVEISISNTLGDGIITLQNSMHEAGSHTLVFNPYHYGLSSGIFFVKVVATYSEKSFSKTGRILFIGK